MIPLKLQLKNFLSYGPEVQTIDFSEYPLICLSGKNGHGKSALLDAITWALWGQARKISDAAKADEGLVRLGQTQMLVILDFAFNGQHYRIRREFSKTYGKPLAVLDFGIIDEETGTLRTLTEKTIRGTQATIEKLLNLDAESFINSAFLRQGQSNEFSKKSSKDRKELLASILGLTRYEYIRKAALEKVKQLVTQQQTLGSLQATIHEELSKQEAIELDVSQVTTQLETISEMEKRHQQRYGALQQEQAHITAEHEQMRAAQTTLSQLKHEKEQAVVQLHTHRQEWRTVQARLRMAGKSTDLEEQKKNIVAAIAIHQKKLQNTLELQQALLGVKEQKIKIEQEARETHQKLCAEQSMRVATIVMEQEHSQKHLLELQHHITEREHEKKQIDAERLELARRITTLQPVTVLPLLEQQFEKRKAHYQWYIAQGNTLKTEMNNGEHKKLLVSDDTNPSCPLCEQNISASRKKFIKATFAKQEAHHKHRLQRLTCLIKKLKELLVAQHEQLQLLKKEQEERTRITMRNQELERGTQKIETTARELQQALREQQLLYEKTAACLKEEQHKLAELKKQESTFLQNSAYTLLLQQQTALETSLTELGYDGQGHAALQQQLHHIDEQLVQQSLWKDQEQKQHERAQIITTLCKDIKAYKKRITEQDLVLTKYANLTERSKTVEHATTQVKQEMATSTQEKERLLQEKGKLENHRAHLHNQAMLYKKNSDELTHMGHDIDDYQAIASATGKDGIQALLIEEAIPEIEQEANHLLAKLTNNQAHIIIESVRDLKKGGTKETLDIKISDPMGIRPYEMFSGGEAFRIDFSLRVAISKLLARRAGTSLQTLIIDEGFGSQDEEGLNHIMDALHKIQDDFAKIIIVSHLPAMKDQFPVHFFIEKGPNGSMVKVMEQG